MKCPTQDVVSFALRLHRTIKTHKASCKSSAHALLVSGLLWLAGKPDSSVLQKRIARLERQIAFLED
jgi:hypothetical protein